MILLGDCLEKLKELEENSVDSVVTDPPYGWRFMGKAWDGADIERMANAAGSKQKWTVRPNGKPRAPRKKTCEAAGSYDISLEGNIAFMEWTKLYATELLRVLKPGGHMLVFCGPRTYHAMAMGIERAGFEIRDQLQWLFGSGFPKSHNGEWGGTALKPANEPIVLARKPLSEKTVKANYAKWGVGGLNIDESRIKASAEDIKKTNRLNHKGNFDWEHSEGTAFKLGQGADISQGRWPANLLLDETAAQMLDEQSGIAKPKARREGKRGGNGFGFFDDDKSANETGVWPSDQGGGASRFFYVAKASKRERNAGLEGMPLQTLATTTGQTRPNKPARLGADPHAVQAPVANHHPTVKPIKLMEYLIKLITPPGGIVLDPFMGSGSTGVAAFKNGFKFIGIEMNEEYCEIARRRIDSSRSS